MSYFWQSVERNWVLFSLGLASLVAALFTGHPLFFSLMYLFGAMVVISMGWAWLNVHWVRVTRKVQTRHVQVGYFFEEQLVLRNIGPLPKLWIELKDQSDLPNHRASRVLSTIGRKQQRDWHVRTPCYQRGRFRLGPVSVISSDPFSLFLFKQDLPMFTSHVIVYPMAVDLANFQPPIGELTGGDVVQRRTHYVTTNVAGVREYSFGDSFNRIHWPTTARTGRLMAKEFELDPMADVWIFLDMQQNVQAGLTYAQIRPTPLPRVHWEKLPKFSLPASTEEYGVTIAASLSQHFLRQNRSLGLITYPKAHHREIAQSDRGERQLIRIYEILAVTQAYGLLPLAELLVSEGTRLGRNTTAIIITPSIEPTWVAAARHLNDRGIRVVAILIDPSSFGATVTSLKTEIELVANHLPHYLIRRGDDLAQALGSRRN